MWMPIEKRLQNIKRNDTFKMLIVSIVYNVIETTVSGNIKLDSFYF